MLVVGLMIWPMPETFGLGLAYATALPEPSAAATPAERLGRPLRLVLLKPAPVVPRTATAVLRLTEAKRFSKALPIVSVSTYVPDTIATPSTTAIADSSSRTLRASRPLSVTRSISAEPGTAASERLHPVQHAIGRRCPHPVDDLAVAEEDHLVGEGRCRRVVRHHDHGLAELADRAPQGSRAPRRWTGSRGCRSARRRRSRRAWRRGPGRRPPAGSGHRTARSGGASAGRRAPACATTWSNQARSTLRPAMSIGSRMFSAAVRVGSRLNCWKMKPMRSRRSLRQLLVRQRARARPAAPGAPPASQTWPGRDGVQAGQAVHEGRLAGPGRPHDRGEDAGREVDR